MRARGRRVYDTVLDVLGGLLIIIVTTSVALTAIIVHGGDLGAIRDNTKQTKSISQQYLAEQNMLSAAGKEQVAFAAWLVEVANVQATNQDAICAALHIECAPVPPLPNLSGLTKTQKK